MTKQPARIQVRETTSVDSYIFEGKLEEIIEMLQDWKEEGEVEWCSGDNSFEYLMDTFVDMLCNKKEEKLKAQKRQEVLNKLTDEEKDLLGVE